ncbi:MAG: NADP-dependent oxidoreductase [Myxococcales bacterium]|nr:NADP-dependent oxidoreductase [Myxococcales bacterium]
MSDYQNRTIVLARRPHGEVQDEDFRMETEPVRELKPGEFLIKVLWLSLDPYMRPNMNDAESYVPPMVLGEAIKGESVGQIVESRSDQFSVGDYVTSYTGWTQYSVANEQTEMLHKLDPGGLPLSVFLGAAGMPGRTGYMGLTRVGKAQAGETVVVSAASGAVGSVVGQVAKMIGCRTVGVAGGEAKCRYVVDELGLDACVDYKAGNLAADLADACPKGIDVYFENVGGDVTRAVAPLLNSGSRVPICGYVSQYNATDLASADSPFGVFGALEKPPEHRFFLVFEWQDEHAETTQRLAEWIKSGQLQYRESVVEGLDRAVDAFRGMLQGKNFGKQLVKVAG